MTVGATSGATGTSTQVVDSSKTGFNGLSANDFMKMLIAQLQNQDPSEPMSNAELLNQISMMRNLQSNIELSDALKSLSSGDQLTSAAGLIGKSVYTSGQSGEPVSGVVDRAFLREGKAFVGIGDQEAPLADVSEVRN